MNKNNKGFTLAEILAVIVILGVLTTMSTIAIKKRTRSARKGILVNDAKSFMKGAEEAYTLEEVEGEIVCHNLNDLSEYVKKNDENYSGTVISEFTNGTTKQIISITDGRYYIFASDNLTVKDVREEIPAGFVSSCDGTNSALSSISQDIGTSTLTYKLFMNEGKSTLTENLSLIDQRTSTVNFDNLEDDETKSGLYKDEDDLGTSYYYRGVVNNNWVEFGGFYWRIIRINGDGSIRLIYTGLKNSNHTGADASIKNSANGATTRYANYQTFQRSVPDASGLTSTNIVTNYTNGKFGHTYVGYMYNPKKVLATYPNVLPSNSNKLNTFPNFTSITDEKNGAPHEYYFFKNFEISSDCFIGNDTDDTGTCTLTCKKLGEDCIKSNWNTLATTEGNYSTTAAGVYSNTNFIYTSPYKYTCWDYGTAVTKANSDGTTSVYISCPLVSEIVGTIKNQPKQARHIIHGLFAASIAESNQNLYESNIKKELDYWYEHNILNSVDFETGYYLESFLSDGIFCNDRSSSYTYPMTSSGGNYYFASYARNATGTRTPTYKCPEMSRDAFTLETTNQVSTVQPINIGNKLLKYPIGLITMDEVIFAGGKYNTANNSYFLNTGIRYFTMTPYGFFTSANYVDIWYVNSGALNGVSASNTYYVRPVINLRSDVIYKSGSGTETDPYIITL